MLSLNNFCVNHFITILSLRLLLWGESELHNDLHLQLHHDLQLEASPLRAGGGLLQLELQAPKAPGELPETPVGSEASELHHLASELHHLNHQQNETGYDAITM